MSIRSQNTQHKLDTNRTPKVHITYDLETLGETTQRELPYRLLFLGDYSGHPKEPLPPLHERQIDDINPRNIGAVMDRIAPRLEFLVPDASGPEGSELRVELNFRGGPDAFRPEAIAQQVEPLRDLIAERERLVEMLTRVKNPRVAATVEKVMADPDQLNQLRGTSGPPDKPEGS